MAITAVTYGIYRHLFLKGLLPQRESLLEFGEANWFGDSNPINLLPDIRGLGYSEQRQDCLIEMLKSCQRDNAWDGFGIASVMWNMFFQPWKRVAIDLGGTPIARQHDLNLELPITEQFGVTINNGTAEHVFNIAQVFRSMHERTKPGGVMIHESPMTGWIDHGFFCIQPTLYFDLAAQNNYGSMAMFITGLGPNEVVTVEGRETISEMAERGVPRDTSLFVLLQKGPRESPFEFPMQGSYRDGHGSPAKNSWSEATRRVVDRISKS